MNNVLLDNILDDNYKQIDPYLPECIDFLKAKGAGRIWHKNGSFLTHSIGVWRIMKLWGLDSYIARAGLMHSIYGSSFGAQCFFKDRDTIKKLVGDKCEEIIFKFCQIDRQELEKRMLKNPAINSQVVLNSFRKKEKFIVTPKELAVFILMSLADFLEQHTSWQELILIKDLEKNIFNFTAHERSLLPLVASGKNYSLWPGNKSPFATRLNYVFTLAKPLLSLSKYIDIPLIFTPGYISHKFGKQNEYGLAVEDEILARNAYRKILRAEECAAVNQDLSTDLLMSQLSQISSLNAYVGEPYLLQAQLCLQDKTIDNRFNKAEKLSLIGLKRFHDWGVAWDKRMSFSGWIAWGRLLLSKAKNRENICLDELI